MWFWCFVNVLMWCDVFWCCCCVILLSEKSGKSKLSMLCDVFAYNLLIKWDMKTILIYEIQKNVRWKICCFWFFDIFVGCWCAHKSEVEIIVLMCKCCNVDVFELFWCENRQVNKQELRNIKNWRLCKELCT